MQQDAEIKQMQSQHSAQAAAAVASNPAASPTAVSAAASASSPQATIDLQKDISTSHLLHQPEPQLASRHHRRSDGLHSAAQRGCSGADTEEPGVSVGVGRQNRLNNYLLCNGMDQQIASIRAQAVHTLSKHFLIEAVHKEAPRPEGRREEMSVKQKVQARVIKYSPLHILLSRHAVNIECSPACFQTFPAAELTACPVAVHPIKK